MKNKLDELEIQIESTQGKFQELISEHEEMEGSDDAVFLSLYKLSGSEDICCRVNGGINDIANCLLSSNDLEVVLQLITAYKIFEEDK